MTVSWCTTRNKGGLLLDKREHFKILDCGIDGFMVINTKGTYEHHTHLKHYNTCELLIKLVCKQVVPDKPYLRTSAKRISRNKKYIQKIDNKIRKDNNKQKFVRVNRGLVQK